MPSVQINKTKKSRKLRIVGVCLVMFIAAVAISHLLSNRNISVDTISGLYRASASTRISQLKLNRDGSFIHEFSDGTHPSRVADKANTGTWDIEETPSGKHVVLSGFVSFAGENALLGYDVHGGWYLLLINEFLGHVKLMYDIDLGLAYEKMPSN